MVMVPPTGTSPPTLGVNTTVAALFVLPATRSTSDTVKELKVTISPMGPLATEATPTVFASCDVVTLTPVETLAVAPPIVKPVSVTVAAVDAATVPLCTFNTTELEVCDVSATVSPPLMATVVGEGEDRKKLAG